MSVVLCYKTQRFFFCSKNGWLNKGCKCTNTKTQNNHPTQTPPQKVMLERANDSDLCHVLISSSSLSLRRRLGRCRCRRGLLGRGLLLGRRHGGRGLGLLLLGRRHDRRWFSLVTFFLFHLGIFSNKWRYVRGHKGLASFLHPLRYVLHRSHTRKHFQYLASVRFHQESSLWSLMFDAEYPIRKGLRLFLVSHNAWSTKVQHARNHHRKKLLRLTCWKDWMCLLSQMRDSGLLRTLNDVS